MTVNEFFDAPHIPDDVPAELLDDITDILARIPPGWGRWISCDKGWYLLVAELNSKLAEIDPTYEIHQLKEKFGALRYYFSLAPLPTLECCKRFDAQHPAPSRRSWPADDPNAATFRSEWDVWHAHGEIHDATEEHWQANAAQVPLREQRRVLYQHMQNLVDAAEKASESTCETCGSSGSMHVRNGWWKTVCSDCAASTGFMKLKEDQ